MPAPGGVLFGQAAWPGVVAVESATFTISHGITPGTCVMRCSPQLVPPLPEGTLVITDGQGTVTLPGCRLDSLKVGRDKDGVFWSLTIVDRRWRWRDLGLIQGCYNQLDPFGKLIPWTIQSPTDLAALCLEAMGETNYVLNLPPGIENTGVLAGLPITNISGVNPPVNWEGGVPPAQALQQVADNNGCRIIYQWSTDTILVTPIGIGNPLPTRTSIHTQGISLKSPETPDAIGIIGSPTRYQPLIPLVAVGKEWDGSYRPIKYLSYAPGMGRVIPGLPQISLIQVFDPIVVGTIWNITIQGMPPLAPCMVSAVAPSIFRIDSYNAIATAINASPCASALVTASASAAGVTITGKKDGVSLGIDVGFGRGAGGGGIGVSLIQEAVKPTKATEGDWTHCPPPLFPSVQATPRLTYAQAVALAQESVWKCYQVINQTAGLAAPLNVPGFGSLLRIQQLVLQDTQVDQVVPQPGDDKLVGPDLQPLNVNFYNGYSRDKPAATYGMYYNNPTIQNGVWYVVPGGTTDVNKFINAPAGSQIMVPFDVDPLRFMITYHNHVYYLFEGGYYEPVTHVLLTGVLVRDPLTNQVVPFTKVIPLPGQASLTNPKMYYHPDVQLNVTSQYNPANLQLEGFDILEADPLIRADAYLVQHLKEFLPTGGQTIDYNGIVPIDVDGCIQQVTWNVGNGQCCSTVASYNTEHSLWVRPYPERRRAEFLDPVQQRLYQFGETSRRINMWQGPATP